MQKETIIAQELTSYFMYSMIERFENACCRLLTNKPILAWLLWDVEMKKEANTMCTYGQSILEEGMEKDIKSQ
ncbi:hypothetical protein [Acidaminococcus massiliensis]|uniref:hypothetical protein n=1 Tax=Acidaminococcus massiliensis TaxID=1852375 RepID=UPI0022E0286F|nr:hypothetical protein [Acidaminococcus massiliensis]